MDDAWSAFPVASSGSTDPWAAFPSAQQPAAVPEDQQRGMLSGIGHATLEGAPVIGPLAEKGISLAKSYLNGDTYADEEQKRQALDADFEQRHPIINTAANIAGGIAATAPLAEVGIGRALLGLTAKSFPGMVAAGAASGAGIGGLDAYIRGGDPEQAAEIGAITGGALPIAGRVIGGALSRGANVLRGPNPAVRGGAENFERINTSAVNPAVPDADVYMTGGQKSGDMKAQQFENAALRGQMDEGSQRLAEDFKTNISDPSLENARTAVSRTLDPNGALRGDDRFNAGVLVKQGVQGAAAQAKADYNALYNKAYNSDTRLNAAGFEGIAGKIKQQLSLPQNLAPGELPEIINPQTAPRSDAALQHINDTISQLRLINRADPMAGPSGLHTNFDSVNMQSLDTLRKTLLGFARSAQGDPNDARIMRKIIGAFDNHVEGMLSDPLMHTGDPAVLDTLKAARAAYSDYRSNFTPDRGDMGVGNAMSKIVGTNGNEGASPEQVMNYVIGSGKIGNSELSRQLAGHIKDVLGDQSPEFGALKQAAWKTLSTNAKGTGQQAQDIEDFLTNNRTVANTLFSPQEQALMQRYAGILKQMTPKPGAVNYSGTGGALAVMKQQAGNALWAMLGAHLAGPVGSIVGLGANAARVAARDRGQMGQVARSIYYSPATNQASQLFAQQMGRYASGAGRALTGAVNQGSMPAPAYPQQ